MFSPGSKIAKEKGCKCDPSRNNFGMGIVMPHIKVPLYVKHEDCPIHGHEAFMREAEDGKLSKSCW